MDIKLTPPQMRVFDWMYGLDSYTLNGNRGHIDIRCFDSLRMKRHIVSMLLDRLINKGIIESRNLVGIEEFMLTEQGKKLGQELGLR